MDDEEAAIRITEFIFLGVDAAIFGVFYKLFSSAKRAAIALKNAPILEINNVKESLVTSGDTIPYAVIKGSVKSTGNPLHSQNHAGVTGVIKEIVIKEHKVKWSWATRWWLETQQEVSRTKNVVPFMLQGKRGTVQVEEPFSARILDLNTVSDKFEPVQSGFGDTVWGFFRGERIRGYQEVEQMLTEGTIVTGIGKMVLDGEGQVKLSPPAGDLRYYLTSQSETAVMRSLETETNFLKVMAVICGVVGCAFVANIIRKMFKQYKKRRVVSERRQLLQELRDRARNTTDGEPNAAPPCVVCLTNPREVVILDCGHVCCCADCAEHLASTCPICRKPISRLWPAYIS